MSALSIQNLSMRYGEQDVLSDIGLEIESGEFLVLVGPSGCGKSTLLNVVAGLTDATSGRIAIGGRDVTRLAPRDRDIAMVFQSYALYPAMTVRGNITFGMRCRGVPRGEQAAAVDRVARLLQIAPLLDRKPAQLSGGQRQRVAIGRALVRDPVLFLFDEPLSNLDAKLRVEMRMEIKRLHQRLGTTIVYVTHDQVEAMTLATRIAVMSGGRIQQLADPQTVYDQPSNLFVARFMGSPPMNVLPARLHVQPGGATVAVAGAPPLLLPRAPAALAGRDGAAVLLGVRPECIREPGSFGPAEARIQARVEMIEPTGADTTVLLDLAGAELLARVDARVRPSLGEVAEFAVDLRQACLFDPETERRIA
jgi:multiple sugar transport system ATP-binding protein